MQWTRPVHREGFSSTPSTARSISQIPNFHKSAQWIDRYCRRHGQAARSPWLAIDGNMEEKIQDKV